MNKLLFLTLCFFIGTIYSLPIDISSNHDKRIDVFTNGYLLNNNSTTGFITLINSALKNGLVNESDLKIMNSNVIIYSRAGDYFLVNLIKSLCMFGTGKYKSETDFFNDHDNLENIFNSLYFDAYTNINTSVSHKDKKYAEYLAEIEDGKTRINYIQKNGSVYYCYSKRQNISFYSENDQFKDKNYLLFALKESNIKTNINVVGDTTNFNSQSSIPTIISYINANDAKLLVSKINVLDMNSSLNKYYKILDNKIAKEKFELGSKYIKFRNKLFAGEDTNCGTVIEFKGNMIHIQTASDAGNIWILRKYLYPQQSINNQIIGCRDNYRWYKRYGNWVQENGTSFLQNSQNYVDYE